MTIRINDEFTKLPIPRENKRRLRKKRDNQCLLCDKPVAKESKNHCAYHTIYVREKQRETRGIQNRRIGARSYSTEIMKEVLDSIGKMVK